MTSEQLDAYIMGFRTAEITDQLRTNDLNHTSGTSTRCLSLTPEYDNTGRRTNSRKQRYRKQLERERVRATGAGCFEGNTSLPTTI